MKKQERNNRKYRNGLTCSYFLCCLGILLILWFHYRPRSLNSVDSNLFFSISSISSLISPSPLSNNFDNCFCGDHGSCLIDECVCVAGYNGKYCNESNPTSAILRHGKCRFDPTQDMCQNVELYGRFRISPAAHQRRRNKAISCETAFWEQHSEPTRNNDQVLVFENFTSLPLRLGHVVEVGAGPYTKVRLMLESNPQLQLEKVTLVDPLLEQFMRNQNIRTSFSSGQLKARGSFHATTLIVAHGEDPLQEEYYDTAVLINTLEHCSDAIVVLSNLYRSLKKGGILIFSESFATDLELMKNDDCHPIQLTKKFLDLFLGKFSQKNFLLGPTMGDSVDGVHHDGVRRSIFAIVQKN